MLKGFRDFILRGNVLDLAVGVIIGAAFGSVVNSLVKDIFTPFIGDLVGKPRASHSSQMSQDLTHRSVFPQSEENIHRLGPHLLVRQIADWRHLGSECLEHFPESSVCKGFARGLQQFTEEGEMRVLELGV